MSEWIRLTEGNTSGPPGLSIDVRASAITLFVPAKVGSDRLVGSRIFVLGRASGPVFVHETPEEIRQLLEIKE